MSGTFLHHPPCHLPTEPTCPANQNVRAILVQELDIFFDSWCLGCVNSVLEMRASHLL
jgi:hypothetical protein